MLILLIIAISGILSVILADYVIKKSTSGKIYNSISALPTQQTGLLLGCKRNITDGSLNCYYENRINAAVELLRQGKIARIIVSGENHHQGYDEPALMREDLIAAGIDPSRIYKDNAGFRTLDSIIRAKEIFGQDSLTIISQKFHNERALYLADRVGIDAIAFNAADVSLKGGLKTRIREYLARVKVFVDLILGQQFRKFNEKVMLDKCHLKIVHRQYHLKLLKRASN